MNQHQIIKQKLLDLCPSGVRTDFSGSTVRFGYGDDLSPETTAQVKELLQEWIPWKKGPFSFFDIEIDSEWRSDLKWDRITAHMPSLSQASVADIGCNNAYYMFRMLEHGPKKVTGYDPVEKYDCQFEWMQHLYGKPWPLEFKKEGVESIGAGAEGQELFDVIFCLGILYHRKNPLQTLERMRAALRPGGYLVIDCQGIAGNSKSEVLFPHGKYAGAKGFWFLPSKGSLESWVLRSGFREISTFFSEKLSPSEQRATAWAPHYQLGDMLSKDGLCTIEGYPAPWRHYLVCRR